MRDPVPPTDLDRQSLMASAERLAAGGQTHEAMALYHRILERTPQDSEVIGRLADLYSELAERIRTTLGRPLS